MDGNLLKILKELREIKPDPDYKNRSRILILAKEKEKPVGFLRFLSNIQLNKLTLAAEITGILIIVTLAGIYYIHKENKNNLVAQANELNASIQLKLNEIKYRLANQPQTNNLDTKKVATELEEASKGLKDAESDLQNNNVEGSLDKIKSVQKIFQELESTLK